MSRLVVNSYPKVSLSLTTLISTALFAYYMIKKRYSYAKKYVRVGKVRKLVVHPIKSCKGVEVDRVTITNTGVKYGQFRDRGWVAIDKDGKMLNLVKAPNLVTIKTSFEDDRFLVLENKFGETIKIEVRTCFADHDNIIHTKYVYCPVENVSNDSFLLIVCTAGILMELIVATKYRTFYLNQLTLKMHDLFSMLNNSIQDRHDLQDIEHQILKLVIGSYIKTILMFILQLKNLYMI